MMRFVITGIFFLLMLNGVAAQSKKYMELRGSTDLMGNITLAVPVPGKEQKKDSLFQWSRIIQCFEPSSIAIDVINRLGLIGWHLQTVAQVNRDQEGRPNTGFLLYYFVKEFKD